MDTVFYMLSAVLILLLIIGFRKDSSLPLTGIKSGMQSLVSVFPILIISFALSGMLRVLLPEELIANFFSGQSGLKGILIGTGAGILTPGGPFVCYPIAYTLLKGGAGIGPVVSYVTAWSLLGAFRIPFEVSLIGTKFALVRLSCSLLFAPGAGYLAGLIYQQVKIQ